VARLSGSTAVTRRRFLVHTLRGELWLIPVLFVIGALVLVEVVLILEDDIVEGGHLPLFFRGTASSGQQVLGTIATSVLSLAALVFSISIVVLQLTSQQFSPRVLRTFNRDPRTQIVLGVFVSTFLYALLALGSLGDEVEPSTIADRLTVTVGLILAVVSLGAFIFHVHHISQAIRVAHIIEEVARETRSCIAANFPMRTALLGPSDAVPSGPPDSVLFFDRRSGVMTTVWFDDLAELARRHDCVLRLLPEVGEYVPRGAPLCEVWGGSTPSLPRILRLVEIEIERTIEIDVAFGFRQLVDIAEKALSPAVNDPTTAVQVIDRLADLVDRLAQRTFPRGVVFDRDGTARVHYEPITWEGIVHLAFDELRDYGAGTRQVARRLRAALLVLLERAPEDRRAVLRSHLELLDSAVERRFPGEEDRAQAMVADDLGVGGER
jgi:uncharacterized membrane protein